MRRLVLLLALPAAFGQVTLQDNRDAQLSCGHMLHCEVRDQTISATSTFRVQGLHNGEATIRGWARDDVRVRVRVTAGDSTSRLKEIHTRVSPGRVTIDGPENSIFAWMFGATWTTDVEVFVPHGTEIYVDSHNGRIQVSDISRRVEARSHNGSLVLDRMAGDVRVALHNGTATVNLAGEPSSIRRIDAECHNGDITVGMPRGFSASVSARTHNGGIRSDFPSNSRASYRDRGNQEFQIGSGGLRVSARTHNGSIRLRQL